MTCRRWQLLQYTALLPRSSGQRASLTTLPHCWAHWAWALDLPHYTASLMGLGGSGSALVLCLSAGEWWAVGLLKYTTSLLGSSGQRISFCTLPHCLTARKHW